jgi:acetolactate synthase-1/2/3 large subunit
MNGAESLVRTLLGSGVEVCFGNPGTSEMHFLAALDRVPGMRSVLCLFEGVVTGAADGYARMADKPAVTLLHLGPGLGNGIANLHNARRARSPIVNVVGEHATYHKRFDAPLTADIEGLARPVSHWVRTSTSAATVARDGAEAMAAALAPPGHTATLILPADTAWGEADGPAAPLTPPAPAEAPGETVDAVARALRTGEPAVLLMTGAALRDAGLRAAARVAAASGARLLCQTSNARWQRGAGRVALERLPYPVDQAVAALAGTRHLVLVGAQAPVAFFAYPAKPGVLYPEDCAIHVLARPEDDAVGALEALAEALDAPAEGLAPEPLMRPAPPTGTLTAEAIATAVAALMPEEAIIVDEAISGGRCLPHLTRTAPPHDWLQIIGGAIGIGPPLATGAAVASPDRKVIALQADGSALYTLQALWTQAREGLDVTTVIYANRSYASLRIELGNVGVANPGRTAIDMLSLDRPEVDWVSLARGLGVEAVRATSAGTFATALARAVGSPGPNLIEAVM